ncbi:MAG: energy transducer TonB [Saprospiraceae bacterium]
MKRIQQTFALIFFTILYLPLLCFSQTNLSFDFGYEINPTYPPLSISKATLTNAQTISDLNKHYQSSWIKEYLAVEIKAMQNGVLKQVNTKNESLSQAQKDLMNGADNGTNISVSVEYIPNNNLKNSLSKEIKFSFLVNPEKAATYPGGPKQLIQYLEHQVIAKISTTSFIEHQLTAVKFSINAAGQVENPRLFESSKDEKIDALLLTAITNMPAWQPARYASGETVKQEFVFTLGDHKSCVLNLLTVSRD